MDTVNAATISEIAHRATGVDRVETEAHLDFDHWRDEGQQILTHAMRKEVERRAPRWARSIEDEALLDPLLVTTLAHPRAGLELSQCLWGLVPAEHRPPTLLARAFEDGRVLLPGLGLLSGCGPFGRVTVHAVDGEPRLHEHPHARLERLPCVGPIPVYPHRHPWMRPYTGHHGTCYADSQVDEPTRHNLGSLNEAMELLAATSSQLHAELCRDVRLVLVVHQLALTSMADPVMHGAVVFSVHGHESPIFFVEELVGRGSEVTFSKVRAGVDVSVMADVEGSSSLGGAVQEGYARVRVIEALEALLSHPPVRGHLRHEVLGRIALSLLRLEGGLSQIELRGLVSEGGISMHRHLVRVHESLRRRLGWVLHRVDVRDQPRAFEYGRFLARNPL